MGFNATTTTGEIVEIVEKGQMGDQEILRAKDGSIYKQALGATLRIELVEAAQAASDLVEAVKDAAGDIVSEVAEAVDEIGAEMSEAASEIADAASDLIEEAGDVIEAAGDAVETIISEASDVVEDFLGGSDLEPEDVVPAEEGDLPDAA